MAASEFSRNRSTAHESSTTVSGAFGDEHLHEVSTCEAVARGGAVAGWSHGDVVSLSPEGDFVAGFDAEFVSEFFGDDDLSLGPDDMSPVM